MAKYRPVYPSQYGSRYVLDAPSEFQQRIPQIDPGFFGGDLQFDEGFGNIGPEPDVGDFMGGFHAGNEYTYVSWNNPDGTTCAEERNNRTGEWTRICGTGTVGFTRKSPTPGPTRPILGRYKR